MATARSFQDMLNEYLPNQMLMEEMIKRDWVLTNVEKDDSWKGGRLITPFEGACASSIEFGQLPDSSDISEYEYVRGYMDVQPEVWGSLIFNHRDLMEHNGKIPETTFLKILPGQVDGFMKKIKEGVSTQLLNGPHFATFTADGTVGGVIEVDHIDRFTLGQKLTIKDSDSAATDVYVIAISIDDSTITVSATRGGAAADVSAYSVAQEAKCYHPGVLTNATFQSMRSALLSQANGGAATVQNVSKLAYPMLQAVNSGAAFGASITATNILDKLFDFYTSVRSKAKGNANTILMSYKHLGSVLKLLEAQKGPFVVTKNLQASLYGWSEITISSVRGELRLVGILEADDDVIMYLDMSTFKFYTNGGFKKRQAPDGREWFELRSTSGYSYIVDICLFGDLACLIPGHNGIINGISY